MKKIKALFLCTKKIFFQAFFILLLATLFSILYQGYYFAVNDGSFYIPYLKSLANPALYPHDLFISTWKAVYFPYLWKMLAFFIKFIPLAPFLLFLHIVFRFLFFWAIYLLSMNLFKKKNIAYLSVMLWFITKPFLGFDILYNEFVQSGVALSLLLFSILLFLKKRYFLAFLLLAFIFLIHPPMAGFVFLGFCLYLLYTKDFRNIFKLFTIVLVIAFPIFLSTFTLAKDSAGYNFAWIELTRIRSPQHSFPFSWGRNTWLPFFTYLLLLSVSLIKYFKSFTSEQFKKIYCLLLVCIVLMLSGFIFSEIIPLPRMIILVPFHSSSIFVILSSFFIIYFIYELVIAQKLINRFLGYALFILFFFNNFWLNFHRAEITVFLVTFLFILLTGKIYKSKNIFARNEFYLTVFLAVILILWLPFMLKKNFLSKDLYYSSWQQVQQWVALNTDKEAVFIVPIYLSGFRVYSERSVVADWKDGSAGYLSPYYLQKWWQIMQDFGLDKKHFNDSYQRAVYLNLKSQKITDLANKYKAAYFITEKSSPYEFEKVYRNDHFVLYKL